MKKTVIVIVAVIYVVSIFFVGLFGIQAQFDNLIIYTTKIECVNRNRYDAKGQLLIDVIPATDKGVEGVNIKIYDFYQVFYEEGASFKIDWRVYPDDVTNSEVRFSHDENNFFYVVTENSPGRVQGTVKFGNEDYIPKDSDFPITSPKISIKTADGSNVETYVKIICLIPALLQQGGQ